MKKPIAFLVSLLIAVVTLFPSLAADDTIAIVGATLIDGSGRAPQADSVVLLKDDTIVAAGKRNQIQIPAGARVIEANGLVLAPGFIDAHNHSDRGFNTDPSAASQVSQGITTVVVGQDGGSPFPVGDFLAGLDKNPIALNVLTFVGHATVRSRVLGEDTNRLAMPGEIENMRELVEQAMREGAMGLSTGLSNTKQANPLQLKKSSRSPRQPLLTAAFTSATFATKQTKLLQRLPKHCRLVEKRAFRCKSHTSSWVR